MENAYRDVDIAFANDLFLICDKLLARFIAMARQVNDSKPGIVVKKVLRVAYKFEEPIISCLGLAFKADIDDLVKVLP